jgi:hypothetical protein
MLKCLHRSIDAHCPYTDVAQVDEKRLVIGQEKLKARPVPSSSQLPTLDILINTHRACSSVPVLSSTAHHHLPRLIISCSAVSRASSAAQSD